MDSIFDLKGENWIKFCCMFALSVELTHGL
jgi:hypothetical protein